MPDFIMLAFLPSALAQPYILVWDALSLRDAVDIGVPSGVVLASPVAGECGGGIHGLVEGCVVLAARLHLHGKPHFRLSVLQFLEALVNLALLCFATFGLGVVGTPCPPEGNQRSILFIFPLQDGCPEVWA